MEDISTVYCYKGFWNCDSICGLEIKRYGEKVTVILTELDHNPGTSVTNMVEQLATMVYHEYLYGVPGENITWVEHYPPLPSVGKDTFDRVEMRWDGKRFYQPQRIRIPFIAYPSPCCGKESTWVSNSLRRCPCGNKWNARNK